MPYPKKNDTVTLAFIGKLDNGEIFITVDEKNPLRSQIGNSDLPPSLEPIILQMKVGEHRKIRISPEEGYGTRQKNLVHTIVNSKMIDKISPQPGMILSLEITKDGSKQNVPATVLKVDGSQITVDYNHPLAGHHLTYDLVLIDIQRDIV